MGIRYIRSRRAYRWKRMAACKKLLKEDGGHMDPFTILCFWSRVTLFKINSSKHEVLRFWNNSSNIRSLVSSGVRTQTKILPRRHKHSHRAAGQQHVRVINVCPVPAPHLVLRGPLWILWRGVCHVPCPKELFHLVRDADDTHRNNYAAM